MVIGVRLLIVEDDVKMAALVRRGLTEEGAAVDVARSGEDALWMASSAPYDAVVLDVMLPGIDGFETCRRLRDDGVWTPVLLLTARDSVDDRVAGLDGGALLREPSADERGHLRVVLHDQEAHDPERWQLCMRSS